MKSEVILREVESILEKNKTNTLNAEQYKQQLISEHKDLYDAYPGIFDMSMNNIMELDRLKYMLSMAENSSIYIEKDAKLIVDGTVITNNHNKLWNGIVFCKSYERKHKKTCRKYNVGTLDLINNGRIENVIID